MKKITSAKKLVESLGEVEERYEDQLDDLWDHMQQFDYKPADEDLISAVHDMYELVDYIECLQAELDCLRLVHKELRDFAADYVDGPPLDTLAVCPANDIDSISVDYWISKQEDIDSKYASIIDRDALLSGSPGIDLKNSSLGVFKVRDREVWYVFRISELPVEVLDTESDDA